MSTRKPRILIFEHYMEVGGAERALLGLLGAIDTEKVDVDVFIAQHTGEFMQYIPSKVNLLSENPIYGHLLRPIKTAICHGHFLLALRRLWGAQKHRLYARGLTVEEKALDDSTFGYIANETVKTVPSLEYLGEYDLAISFRNPHQFVLSKVKAKKKICWIHTDYSTIHVNRELELPVWGGYDHIASISPECTRAFVKTFPELESKIIEIENILSPTLVREQSLEFDPTDEMPDREGEVKILSIGRFCYPKRFDEVARMCRLMLDAGAKFRWYIIGFGDDTQIRQSIADYNVADTMILLGKKTNPYPYIRRCDIYAQPSRYEGKSVTVREAQVLGKPVAITNYPTAASQVTDGVDGCILPFETDDAALALARFISDTEAQKSIADYLTSHDYGNEAEVEKIYQLLK